MLALLFEEDKQIINGAGFGGTTLIFPLCSSLANPSQLFPLSAAPATDGSRNGSAMPVVGSFEQTPVPQDHVPQGGPQRTDPCNEVHVPLLGATASGKGLGQAGTPMGSPLLF